MVIVIAIITGILIFKLQKGKETINQDQSINEENNYSVVFKYENGTENVEQKIGTNGIIERPEDPEKEEHLFIEWQKDGEIFDFSQKVNQDIELTAKYQAIEEGKTVFIVKYNSDGGNTIANEIVE